MAFPIMNPEIKGQPIAAEFLDPQSNVIVEEEPKPKINIGAQRTKENSARGAGMTAISRTQIPKVFAPLFQPNRYKVFYGGRGGAKSWNFARALIIMAMKKKLRILCTRELQISISDSVHRILEDQIYALGAGKYFEIQKTSIRCIKTGSEFIFKGLRHNATEIKSTEGIDICWVEEAQRVSDDSWRMLIPTIRKAYSEIWISFNPENEEDPTYQRFIVKPMPGSTVIKVNYYDNPFFPDVLRQEMEYCRATDFDAYMNVWEGECVKVSDAVVFKNRIRIDVFEAPKRHQRIFFGADWGFANDPCVLSRFYVNDERLFIEYEAYEVGVELDHIPALFDQVPGSREWPIHADNSRPETISYIKRQGFNISAAEKWPGCEEDGVAHLKTFKEIVIHERCKHAQFEVRNYKYKVDRQTGDVLPILVDKHNHCIDSWRYGLDGYIMARGSGANLIKAVNS